MIMAKAPLADFIAAGREMPENMIPVMPCFIQPVPGGKPKKKPIPHPETHSHWPIDDPDTVETVYPVLYQRYATFCHAVGLGPKYDSPLIAVDIDGPSGMVKARELGVSSGDDCWIQRTGGGADHFQIFYDARDLPPLKRVTGPNVTGLQIDLLIQGYAIIPPSRNVLPYEWRKGPADVPACELCPPPKALIEWWESLSDTPAPTAPQKRDGTDWGAILDTPITEASPSRHNSLMSIGGHLLSKLGDEGEVRAMLQIINETRCKPPVPAPDVDDIVTNLVKREGAKPKFRPVPVVQIGGA